MADNYDLAENLWAKGAGHVIGAIALFDVSWQKAPVECKDTDYEKFVFNGPYSASIHFLLGFAFELLVKSAFILHGGDPSRLGPREIGHDLSKALEAAKMQGFSSQITSLESTIAGISDAHREHAFRYSNAGTVNLPPLAQTVLVAEYLAEEIGQNFR